MSEKQYDLEQTENPSPPTTTVSDEPDRVTWKVWLVVFILSWGYGLSFIPVPVFASIGPEVATSFGDAGANAWFVSSWIVSITVAFVIAGANTDLMGRRWFLIAGQIICTIGHIITATAQSNVQIIVGMTIEGFGAALCQMAAFALPELLPNRWRAIGVVLADVGVYATIIIIPVTARYGWYAANWRGNFIAAAALQALSAIGLFVYYHPPAHPLGIPFRQALREADWLGMLLITIGAVLALVGIVYTASLPASNPRVIATLVVGFVFLLAFGLWETFGTAKRPLTPPHVFARSKGRDFTAPAIALAIINMFYYSSSIIWPTMINAFYTNGGQPWQRAAVLSLPQGCAITAGAIFLTVFGHRIKRYHWIQTTSVFIMVLFGSLLALATPDNFGLMTTFLCLSLFGYGIAIYLSIAFTQLGVPQKELGISGGLSGCVRFAGGSVAQAVYLSVFQNDVAKQTVSRVSNAAANAGLSTQQITALLSSLTNIPKLTADFGPEVVAVVGRAQQLAIAHGIRLVALTSMAFGIVGIIACLCCNDIDSRMDDKIEVFLENDVYADKNQYH